MSGTRGENGANRCTEKLIHLAQQAWSHNKAALHSQRRGLPFMTPTKPLLVPITTQDADSELNALIRTVGTCVAGGRTVVGEEHDGRLVFSPAAWSWWQRLLQLPKAIFCCRKWIFTDTDSGGQRGLNVLAKGHYSAIFYSGSRLQHQLHDVHIRVETWSLSCKKAHCGWWTVYSFSESFVLILSSEIRDVPVYGFRGIERKKEREGGGKRESEKMCQRAERIWTPKDLDMIKPWLQII